MRNVSWLESTLKTLIFFSACMYKKIIWPELPCSNLIIMMAFILYTTFIFGDRQIMSKCPWLALMPTRVSEQCRLVHLYKKRDGNYLISQKCWHFNQASYNGRPYHYGWAVTILTHSYIYPKLHSNQPAKIEKKI